MAQKSLGTVLAEWHVKFMAFADTMFPEWQSVAFFRGATSLNNVLSGAKKLRDRKLPGETMEQTITRILMSTEAVDEEVKATWAAAEATKRSDFAAYLEYFANGAEALLKK